jgi:hypothetical protein
MFWTFPCGHDESKLCGLIYEVHFADLVLNLFFQILIDTISVDPEIL